MCDQRDFFDLDERPDERYAALSNAGDPMERLSSVIGFEIFRPEPDAALKRVAPGNRQKNDKPSSGRKNPLFFMVSGYVQ